MTKIYHYTKFENYNKILKEDKIVFLLSNYQKFGEKGGDSNEGATMCKFIKDNFPNIVDVVLESRYVLSFCKSRFNPYMWEHYADDYKGICLEFSYASIEETQIGITGHLMECSYDGKIPENTSLSLMPFKDITAEECKYGKAFTQVHEITKRIDNLMAIKGTEYYKEEEIRMTVPHIYPRVRDNGKKCEVHFAKYALTNVYIGENCTKEQFQDVKQHLRLSKYNLISRPIKIGRRDTARHKYATGNIRNFIQE